MSTLERAIEIAANAHSGQTDKGGQPYVLHPIRVMLSVTSLNERMAAILHDVVEDTEWTLEALLAEGFPGEVVAAVEALTKHPGEARIDAAGRARRNPIARAVKIADVTDNMNIDRIATLTEKDHARLSEYKQVKELLLSDDLKLDRNCSCACERPPFNYSSADHRELGDDPGCVDCYEVSMSQCRDCGFYWLRYLIEQPHYTKAGRWWRVKMSAKDADGFSAAMARSYIEDQDWCFVGGSYYDGAIRIAERPIRVN